MFPISSVEDILEVEKTPLDHQDIAPDPYSLLSASATKFAGKPALIMVSDPAQPSQATPVSYRTLLEQVTQYANMFADCGIGQSGVISYLLPNSPETHYVIWGGQTAGIVNPINPYLEAPAIASIIRTAKTKLMVCAGPSIDKEIWEKTSLALEECPEVEIVLTLERDTKQPVPAIEGKICKNIAATAAIYDSDGLDFPRQANKDKISAYFCTGGTTGVPKLAQLTSFNQTFVGWALQEMMQGKPGDTYFCGLPLFHINAVVATGMLPFTHGGCVILLSSAGFRNRDVIANFWALADYYKPITFSGVPTVYSALLQNAPAKNELSYLKFGICGAAPISATLKQSFFEKTGVRIVEGYGMTEGTCVTSLNLSDHAEHKASVGFRIPYQQVQIASFSPEGDLEQTKEAGQPGVLAIKGPNVFKGYINPNDNDGQFTKDGWFITGDLSTISEDGFLYLKGRSKDVIIRGGHNIDPQMIEDTLSKHPAVQLAAAVGSPDAYAGELPVAYVQLFPGQMIGNEELAAFAQKAIPERAAVPSKITILNEMPTTSVGKIFKPKLRELAAEDAAERLLKDAKIPGHVQANANKAFAHGLQISISTSKDFQDRAQDLLSALPVSIAITHNSNKPIEAC